MNPNKNYRPNVAAIIMSSNYPEKIEYFVAERTDLTGIWQFPQGGIDEGESAQEALYREMLEEIGTDKIEIVSEYPEWLSYDFPEHIAQKMRPFDGQKQRYYLVKLHKDAVINLDTEHPEFIDHKFVNDNDLPDIIAHFKKDVYFKAIEYFKKEELL
jgi:putative (di)nucleoside polyphosphate hydrolase